MCLHKIKNPSDLDPAPEKLYSSIPFTFLDMSLSATAGHFPHSVLLVLRHAETTVSDPQPVAPLQTGKVQKLKWS
jgi:hypothetical protein